MGRFLLPTPRAETADLDSGLSFPKSFLGGPTRLTSHKEARRLNSLMMLKYSDIWSEVLFNYCLAKGKPLFPNLSCSYGVIFISASMLLDNTRKYLLQSIGSRQ